jgi:hypothetical protein
MLLEKEGKKALKSFLRAVILWKIETLHLKYSFGFWYTFAFLQALTCFQTMECFFLSGRLFA